MKLPFLSTPNRLCLVLALWIVLSCNGAFWELLFTVQGTSPRALLFAVSLGIALLGLNLLLLRLPSPGWLLRPVLSLLVLLAAAAGWFMDTWGVALDSEMLRNALQTDFAEARDFIGWPLLWRALWVAGPAIALVWMVALRVQDGWQLARDWLLGCLAGVALVFIAGLPLYGHYVSYFRNEASARYLIAPANVVVGSVRLLRKSLQVQGPHVEVGLDARRAAQSARPLLMVLVVGETARAANFSLGGYARDTNPELARRGVFYFTDVTACGTATAMSLPCMFSDLPREEFRLGQARRRDSVLDIMQRAGVAVRWIDNQSGCKGVCDRVPNEMAASYFPEACSRGECLDATLLHALDAQLSRVTGDTLLVLHAMGSHGPAYHRRVPPTHAPFQPACNTGRIETCSDEAIVNAYDNTIFYADHILAGLIDRLAAAGQVDPVLLYVSDHGESLGERGLYLHGQPWRLAPAVQKRVPMLLWLPNNSISRLGIDTACLRRSLPEPGSHDDLSHTLLGLAGIETNAYRRNLDLIASCRPVY
ncbi:MAG: phosphoethanolamine--lipid A transferase [Pseudomonadota bacterium]|nr:phosphoethanolamine--lipid A transferase [Pseudomonadota bacterium]